MPDRPIDAERLDETLRPLHDHGELVRQQVGAIVPASHDQAAELTSPSRQMLVEHKIDVAFLAEPYISIAEQSAGVTELTNLDQGAGEAFPMRGYTVTKQFAKRYPRTLAAFERALEQGHDIADTDRHATEIAIEAFKGTDGVTPETAALLTFDLYPVSQVDTIAIQRVADDMFQFGLLKQSCDVRQMIG